MKSFKLSHTLSLLMLLAVIILVGFLAIYFDTVLKKNHMENTKKRMVQGFTRLYNEFEQFESDLKEGVSFIQTDKYLLSSIDLVNKYQNKDSYNAILLDEEKKLIAKQLLDRVKLSLNDDIALHDKREEMIAFVQKEKEGYRLNFFSYENGNRILYSKLESEREYQKVSYEEDPLITFEHISYYSLEKSLQSVVTYHYVNKKLFIKSHQSLYDDRGNEIQAHIEMSHKVTERYLSELSSALGMEIKISSQSPYEPGALLLGKSKEFEKLKVLDSDGSYYSVAKLGTEDGDIYFTAKLNTSILLKTFYENRYQLLMIIAVVTLFILALLHFFVNRRLTKPLNQLMGQIEKIEQSDYSKMSLVQTGDELEVISNNINQLAQTISKRESQLKASKKSLEFLSLNDSLTGLPNRRFFMSRLKHAIDNAERTKTKLAVMFLDIDQFKHINDTLGHNVGDKLLQKVSKRLDERMRAADTLARVGGDEFNILIENIEKIEEIEVIVEKLLEAFNEPFLCQGGETLNVIGSIGIAVYPDDTTDSGTLIKYADMAMYHCKEESTHYRFFSSKMAEYIKTRSTRINALKAAIASENEFALVYQPKISLHTGKVVSIEALVRWENASLGPVRVDEFIALAEETNIIVPLGKWIAKKACSDFMALKEEGYDLEHISINVSNKQFYNSDMVSTIQEIINETGIDAKYIELEMTETFAAGYEEQVLHALHRLREMHIDLAIDDFGTGYSSMSYLQRLPVSRLKIDKSFIDHIPDSEESVVLVEAIMAIAKTFKLRITAEGVENAEQVAFLSEAGCDEIQGYYYAKPMDIESFKRYYDEFNMQD